MKRTARLIVFYAALFGLWTAAGRTEDLAALFVPHTPGCRPKRCMPDSRITAS